MDERAHLGLGIQWIAHFQLTYSLNECRNKLFLDRVLNEKARTRCAALPVQAVDHEYNCIERPIKIGVVKNNDRVFAAQFKVHSFQGGGTLRNNMTTR